MNDSKTCIKVFFKVDGISRSLCQKLRYSVQGLIKMNEHVRHERSTSSGSKVMAKVKVFIPRSNFKVKITR